jgi:hypothetical protein
MTRPARPGAIPLPAFRTLIALVLAVVALLSTAGIGLAADASPATVAPLGDVRMTARPLLGGAARPGAWMAVRVQLENDGPAISGELQVTGGQQQDTRFGVPVELPTGARQEHLLYAQPNWVGKGLVVNLVADDELLLSQPLTTRAVDAWTPTVVVVAERPEAIAGDIRTGVTPPNLNAPVIITVPPGDLPTRVEAWSAIDRLVWQDVDTTLLTEEQLTALSAWVSAGGILVVAGGTTGTSTLGGLPPDLLPFLPTGTVDVAEADLAALLGDLPDDAGSVPAVAGTLTDGVVLGRSGDQVFAAQRRVGQGTVTVLGIDPATDWLAGTDTASSLWRRFLPANANGAVINPLTLADDNQIVQALSNLPSVDLPDLGVLFALLLLYIALIGPINYLVLRRLDRREWAWVTMPVLVGVFAVAAYALGATLKGTDTIVNQVGIVRTSPGSDTGLGQVYVGIFSPTRASYDVNVSNGALLTNPLSVQQNQNGTPLDVQQGDTGRLRDFQVGFAVLRTFRAEAPVRVPRLETDLAYRDGSVVGTLTNRSELPLHDVIVNLGRGVQTFREIAPGQSVTVAMKVADVADDGNSLSWLAYGPWPDGGVTNRTEMTRRMVLDQYWYSAGPGSGAPQAGPVIYAWTSGPELAVTLGSDAKQVGDTLHIYPAPVVVSGPTTFGNPLMTRSVVASTAADASDQGWSLSLSRGTMTVEFRPSGYGGPFDPTTLSLMLTAGEFPALTGRGILVGPLPADQQPPQDDPVAGVTRPVAQVEGDGGGVVAAPDAGNGDAEAPARVDIPWDGIPDIQLFDRTTGLWMELPHVAARREVRIAEPERYVDETGAFLARFVNRGDVNTTTWFVPLVRLEGEAA